MEDGTQLAQSTAILRYLAKMYKGPNEEVLYPPNSDPTLLYDTEMRIQAEQDLWAATVNFMIPLVPGYKNKDDHFVNFIINVFPKYL